MPILNPFDEPLSRIKLVLADLSTRKDTLEKELAWFDSTNINDLNTRLAETLRHVELLRNRQQESVKRIASHQRVQEALDALIRTMFNPRNWFASDQIQLRQQRKEIVFEKKAEQAESSRILDEIDNTVRSVADQEKTIVRYCAFDATAHRENLREIENQFSAELFRGKKILARKKAVDKAVQPIIAQLRQYEQLKQRAESDRERAATLDRAISNASNSYEKAMVHKQCESEFGVGRPMKVVERCSREIERISRDYEKAFRRAVEVGQKASRTIDAIVVDGNNLCYAGNNFIGLAALKSAITILRSDYTITLVFDAAIRRMLRADDQAIGRAFGDGVTVHVVSTGGKADETILDLAESDKSTYVLSNDRFSEYNDKSAVRENRILRHEIVKGSIFIRDLNLAAAYSAT